MSSIHSLHGLHRLPVPSIIPVMTSLIFLLFFILHICPNNPNFLLITACIKSFVPDLFICHLLSPVYLQQPPVAIHFKRQNLISVGFYSAHASQAYNAVLNTHVFKMFSLVVWLICLLFHILLNSAITPFAFAILLFISFVQSLSHVNRLPR